MKMNHSILSKSTPIFFLITFLIIIGNSCQEGQSTGKSIEEIKADGKISSIIRSPISADGMEDTVNVAKMVFEELTFDFGEVAEGDIVKHTFSFTNKGNVPLIINDAHSTCGCTIPKWPEDAIPPGKNGKINVEFNTKAKPNFQEKPVIINANTYPSVTKLFIKGYVKPAK